MSKVIEILRQIEADAHVLTVKLHNYHWNVKGPQFSAIHAYTEEAYDEMFEIFDDVAERVAQLGGKPIICPRELVETAKIAQTKADSFDAKGVIDAMKGDYEYMLGLYCKLASAADEAGDRASAGMADEKIAAFQKRLWMIDAMLSA